jgi:hypothetical protein
MVKGSSFSLDTKEPRKTRVHGNGLLIDLDVLEIEMGGGILRYSPTHVEFVSLVLSVAADALPCVGERTSSVDFDDERRKIFPPLQREIGFAALLPG